jgi:hypothetical protein
MLRLDNAAEARGGFIESELAAFASELVRGGGAAHASSDDRDSLH